MNAVDYMSKIEMNQGSFDYALYGDGVGIGDPGYYVLKIEKGVKPEDVNIDWTFNDGVNREQEQWRRERTILSNYAEAGYFLDDPKIELLHNRFIVMSRGDIYHGLYDIKNDTTLIGSGGSPWHGFIESDKSLDHRNKEEYKRKYKDWMRKNYHDEIEAIMKSSL